MAMSRATCQRGTRRFLMVSFESMVSVTFLKVLERTWHFVFCCSVAYYPVASILSCGFLACPTESERTRLFGQTIRMRCWFSIIETGAQLQSFRTSIV